MANISDQQTPALPLPQNIWLHGFSILIILVFLHVALWVLGFCAVLQFLWMLFARERNVHIAGFGAQLANWLAISARFVSGSSDLKPFPWTEWR